MYLVKDSTGETQEPQNVCLVVEAMCEKVGRRGGKNKHGKGGGG